jgi:hypothetical protein
MEIYIVLRLYISSWYGELQTFHSQGLCSGVKDGVST